MGYLVPPPPPVSLAGLSALLPPWRLAPGETTETGTALDQYAPTPDEYVDVLRERGLIGDSKVRVLRDGEPVYGFGHGPPRPAPTTNPGTR